MVHTYIPNLRLVINLMQRKLHSVSVTVVTSVHDTIEGNNFVSIIVIYMYVFHVCVCLSVHVLGRRSATLLSPTWGTSPGRLHQLVFQLVKLMV